MKNQKELEKTQSPIISTFCLAVLIFLSGVFVTDSGSAQTCGSPPPSEFQSIHGNGQDGAVSAFVCSDCSPSADCPTYYLTYITGVHKADFTITEHDTGPSPYDGPAAGENYLHLDDEGTTTTIDPNYEHDCVTPMPVSCSLPYPCQHVAYNSGTCQITFVCLDGDTYYYSWDKDTTTGGWYGDSGGFPGAGSDWLAPIGPPVPDYYSESVTYSDNIVGPCTNQTETITLSESEEELNDDETWQVVTEGCPDKTVTITYSGGGVFLVSDFPPIETWAHHWTGSDFTETKYEDPYAPQPAMENAAYSQAEGNFPNGTNMPPWQWDLSPTSSRSISATCASDNETKYRIPVIGTDPSKKYRLSWTQITYNVYNGVVTTWSSSPFVTPPVQGQTGLWYYPAITGANLPTPTWPSPPCPGGINEIIFVGPVIISED